MWYELNIHTPWFIKGSYESWIEGIIFAYPGIIYRDLPDSGHSAVKQDRARDYYEFSMKSVT